MTRNPFRLSKRLPLALGGFVALLCTPAARAEYLILRNETRVSLVVQTASVVRGVLKRDQALLKPGEVTGKIPLDSDKVVTIYDGRTGRMVFRDSLRASRKPLGFGIIPDRLPMRVRVAPRALPNAAQGGLPAGIAPGVPQGMPLPGPGMRPRR